MGRTACGRALHEGGDGTGAARAVAQKDSPRSLGSVALRHRSLRAPSGPTFPNLLKRELVERARSAMLRRALAGVQALALRASVGPLAHEPPLRHLPLRVDANPPWSGASCSACTASCLGTALADGCACYTACRWRGAASQALLLPQPLLPATGPSRRSGAAVVRGWAAQQLQLTAAFATPPRAGVTAPAAVAGMQRGGVRVVMVSPNVSDVAAPLGVCSFLALTLVTRSLAQVVAEPYPGRQPWLPLSSLFTGAGWRELGNRVRLSAR